MSTVVCTEPFDAEIEKKYMVLAKGAPESLKECLAHIPEDYDDVYIDYARKGYRVIALAYKKPSDLDRETIRQISREEVESGLTFCGFAVFSCPLKPSSRDTLLSLKQARHRVIMITGDAMLTACHTAQEVHIADKTPLFLQKTQKNGKDDEAILEWTSYSSANDKPFDKFETSVLSKQYSLCVPGKVVSMLWKSEPNTLKYVVPFCSVFARTSPDEKEIVVKTLKDVGHTVLMCGDGTNDVGALKAAHIGVALMNSKPVHLGSLRSSHKKRRKKKDIGEWLESLQEEEDDGLPVVGLGDASIASPFTARYNIVTPCIDIIKQGRSTLVTYIQMFKILGINCLSSAYCMSVMYLNGVKMGDTQATISGVIIAFLFMFLSNSQPHTELSSKRPHSKVFCRYLLVSILGQFVIHLCLLIGTYEYALTFKEDIPAVQENPSDTLDTTAMEDTTVAKADFKPNIVNTVAYLVNFIIQLSTFAANYVGKPFNVSMWQNKGLIYGLIGSSLLVVALISGLVESLNDSLELVALPGELKIVLLVGGMFTWVLSTCVERLSMAYFPERIHENFSQSFVNKL